MIEKVLVANRAEIAVRVIRACREMGIKSVAVFSDADRDALHVRLADEAVHIGASEPLKSYLDGKKLVEAARRTGADAVHPGYGFLSENAGFARLVEDAGLAWIGPPSTAIAKLGNKLEVRKTAKSLGIPTVPGSDGPVEGKESVTAAARAVGFPVMLKAAAGGGGKGIRTVRDESELVRELERAAGEARSAFGSSAVFLERNVSPARHIEVQVLADARGNVIHLGERECSLQRRHQKIVEESPSTVVTPELRARLGEHAVRLAKHAGYRNAGTVEFLVDEKLDYYLLEMNTRLQVEHPVTEMVTGLDLVRAQLEVASGLPLPWKQEEIRHRGAAIELRVTAEDVFANFAPSAGTVRGLALPGGAFTRVDTALEEGTEVSLFYDPLLAKLVVWAEDRPKAIARLTRAAAEFRVSGVRTTLPLVAPLSRDPDFRAGRFHVTWLEGFVARATERVEEDLETAAIVAALAAHRSSARPVAETAAASASAWAHAWRPR
ncbi:MAG TPA: acetyl-CoA carboxylase biotin carboxylase subunit [Planctomycetota bacterium]|nr:acetyl-CoA carboxylase biotin carboxylase subunit [Planctomycetota bacterium]